MGQGLNTETKKADEWAYGAIAQYHQLLATDAKPLTVYAFNTSTGFHPPHSDTVYRSDDGGETWRASYFQDPRFQRYNVAPDWETASCRKSFKGGETPFGVAICNSDPNRVMLGRRPDGILSETRKDGSDVPETTTGQSRHDRRRGLHGGEEVGTEIRAGRRAGCPDR